MVSRFLTKQRASLVNNVKNLLNYNQNYKNTIKNRESSTRLKPFKYGGGAAQKQFKIYIHPRRERRGEGWNEGG